MRYLLFLLMLMPMSVYGQGINIQLFDEQTHHPVVNANICIESLNRKIKLYVVSDLQGKAKIEIAVRAAIVVSAIGYNTEMDTLNPGDSRTIFLQQKAYDVDEVVVTGQQKAISADKSIYKVGVISNSQIKSKGATNLTELLSTELNMRVSQDGSLGTNISLQGLSGEYVKILVDGIPVIGRQNGILDLSQVLLTNVDHIEIVEGPMSVIYGNNALAGAINIITKQPMHGKIIGNVNLDYESVGVYNIAGGFSVIKKKNTFSLYGGRNFFNGYSFSDTSRVKDWKPKEQYFADVDYIYSGEKARWKFNSNLFREKLINSGAYESYIVIKTVPLPSGNDTTTVYTGYNASDQYHYTTRINFRGEFQYAFSSKSQINTTLALSLYNKIKNTYVKDFVNLSEILADSSAQDTTRFRNIIFRSVYSNSVISWLEYMAGTDLNIETGTGKRLNGEKRIDDYAIFSSMKLFPQQKINVQVGARSIYNSRFSAPLIYSLNLKYSPIEVLGFRASYGKGFRAPSLKELYLEFQDINHNVYGNENLKAEYSHNYCLSVDYNLIIQTDQMLHFELSLFRNKISNKIDFIYDTDNPTWAKYYNIPSNNYVSKGAEFKWKYNFHPRFSLSSGINYLSRSKVSDLNSFFTSTDYSIDFKYKNLKYLFRIAAYYKYTGDWYTSRMQLNTDGANTVTDGFVKGYHSLNVTLSRLFFKNRLDVVLGAKNLFGNTSVVSYGSGENVHGGSDGSTVVGWGRSFFVHLTYNFIKY